MRLDPSTPLRPSLRSTTGHHVQGSHYQQFYTEKAPPLPEQEGAIQVLGFDGKGVSVIKEEAAKLKTRQM